LYHAQAIHWIEAYPAVPGLGNLHGRLAFNSVWFITNALFSFSFLNFGSFHLSSSFLFLLFLTYCWKGFEEVLQGNSNLTTIIKTVMIPIAFLLIGTEVSSPGTDLPVDLILWLIIIIWVENIETRRQVDDLIVSILSFFAVTLKISSAPILLFPLVLLLMSIDRYGTRRLVLIISSGVVIVLPFILRNIILSGYLIYPVTTIDYFNFDWKVPVSRVEEERRAIMAWARFSLIEIDKVLAIPIRQWIPAWFALQTTNRKLTLILGIFSFMGLFTRRTLDQEMKKLKLAWLIMYIGVLFWLFSAPDFRFGYGFLVPVILIAIIPWFLLGLESVSLLKKMIPVGTTIIMATFLAITFVKSFDRQSVGDRFLFPANYVRVPTEVCNLNNGEVYCAKQYASCSYYSFPCVPNPRPWVQFRGKSLRDGFRSMPGVEN